MRTSSAKVFTGITLRRTSISRTPLYDRQSGQVQKMSVLEKVDSTTLQCSKSARLFVKTIQLDLDANIKLIV